jgi:hypothetical protein
LSSAAAAGTAWDLAFSADPGQTLIYDADGEQEVLWILDRESGELVGGFGRPGHMPGHFTLLHSLAVDSAGNLYVSEVQGRRVQRFRKIARPGP